MSKQSGTGAGAEAEGVTAVRCHRFGHPGEVLQVERLPCPEPGPGEVRVRMLAAPVNPADINVIQGKYGSLPALPAYLGNEGAGVVARLGPGVRGLQAGQLVRPVPGVGSWRQALVAGQDQVTPLPTGLDPEAAAMLGVNPATAWRMLHDYRAPRPGAWVVQNAGTSAVGRLVIQLCRHLGLRSLSVVRRADAVDELLGLGADAVITEEESSPRRIRGLCADGPPLLGLNGVGGRSASTLALALGPGGTLVTYGAMGLQPVALPNGPLIFKELRHVGFWVTAWYRRAEPAQVQAMLQELGRLFSEGVLTNQVEQRYPLDRAAEAVAHAQKQGRKGKILFTIS